MDTVTIPSLRIIGIDKELYIGEEKTKGYFPHPSLSVSLQRTFGVVTLNADSC